MEEIYDELSKSDSLNNDNFLLSCLEAYKKSIRPYKNLKDGKRYSNYYEFLTTSASEDKTEIDKKSYEKLYVKMTNEWIDSIKNTKEDDIDEYDIEGLYYLRLKAELKRTSPVKTIKDIERLYSRLERKIGDNINNFFWRHVQNESRYPKFDDALKSFTHISSKYTKFGKEGITGVDYRLYINCANSNIFELIDAYIENCQKRNIPYLIKFTTDKKRQEKFLVYTSKDNLEENIKILKNIGKTHPKIKKNCGPESPITGNIDNWIGLGSEPENEKLDTKFSFNSLRAQILEDSAEKTILDYIKRNFKRQYVYKKININLQDIILLVSSAVIIEEMKKTKTHTDGRESRFDNKYKKELIETLATDPKSNIIIGLKKLEQLSDNKNLTIFKNKDAIFELDMPNKTPFFVSIEVMDKIVKSLVDILIEIEPNLIELYRSEIRKLCPKYHVDPNNFSLNIKALQDFKIIEKEPQKETKNNLYQEANSIIFNIIIYADRNINSIKIEKMMNRAIEIIEIIKTEYSDTGTALLLAKNLNFALKTYEEKTEKRIRTAKHIKKSKEEIELEEIISHMESLSEAHKEIMIQNIREKKYREENNPHPKHF